MLTASILGISPSLALDPEKSIDQYTVSSWQVEQGLPQNTVRAIAQTPDGHLWIGTQAGLVRFDGSVFRVLDRRSHPEVFTNHHIYCLETDTRGSLWIGTNGGGLLRLEGGELAKGFRRWGTAEGLPSGRITALASGPRGLWIGTYGGGLALYQGGELELLDTSSGLPHDVVFDLALDDEGFPWVATYGGGVAHWNGENFKRIGLEDGLPDLGAWAVLPTPGGLWIGTDRGLVLHQGDRSKLFGTHHGLSNRRAISLLEDREGNLWVGTYGGGINRWNGEGFESLDQSSGLGSSAIWRLFEDREGILWFGTLGGGLGSLEDGDFVTFGIVQGLPTALTSTLFEEADGSLLVGTRGAGLHRLVNGRFDRWEHGRQLPAQGVWSLLRDRREALWVATNGGGLLRWDGRASRIWDADDGLPDNSVFELAEDFEGAVWAGGNSGLWRWREGHSETFTVEQGLPSNQIRSLVPTAEGLWIGTTGGLAFFDGQTFATFSTRDGLTSDNVWDILPRDDGGLWIATYGGGINRFHDERFDAWTSTNGLEDDDVTLLVRDGSEHLWLGTGRGLFRVSERDLDAWMDSPDHSLAVTAFGRSDGIRSDGGGLPTGLLARDGRLWFSHFGGVSVVDPRELMPQPAPEVVIEGVEVAGRILAAGDPPLPADSKSYRIAFAAPTLVAPEKIRLRYRLVGFDDRWIETTRRLASYSFLEPGKYRFEVMASDSDRRWNGPVTSFAFAVTPSFFETRIFFACCILALALVALALHKLRVAGLERRERHLARRVDEELARVKILRGLLPICSQCKKVRDDAGYWQELEAYVGEHSEASLSHSFCPDCIDQLYPGLADRVLRRQP